MARVEYKHGSLFESDCDILVNPVNTVGVQGAGLAKAFKLRYADTDQFERYRMACMSGRLKLGGTPIVWKAPKQLAWNDSPRLHLPDVCWFPTKAHWKQDSDLDAIRASMSAMQAIAKPELSVAFCKIGCGLGALSFEDQVKPLMDELLPLLNYSYIEVCL